MSKYVLNFWLKVFSFKLLSIPARRVQHIATRTHSRNRAHAHRVRLTSEHCKLPVPDNENNSRTAFAYSHMFNRLLLQAPVNTARFRRTVHSASQSSGSSAYCSACSIGYCTESFDRKSYSTTNTHGSLVANKIDRINFD